MADEHDAAGFLIAPISSMIEAVGASVARASIDLNRAQLAALEDYPEDLRRVGMLPTIFHMQAVEVELKLALHIKQTKEPVPDDRGLVRRGIDWLLATPVNADYVNGKEFNVEGASSLRMHFAPGPPPGVAEAEGEQDG